MTILEQIADYIVNYKHSVQAKEEAEDHLVDTLSALICSKNTPEGYRILSKFNNEQSSLLKIIDGRSGVLDDVVLYTSLTRLTEIDDIHLASCTTPGSVIIPTVLALTSGLKDLSYEEILDSLIIGYDTMTRLGQTIDGANLLLKGIWPTYFCGAFGSATAASRLLGLSKEHTVHALALSLTMSTGGVSRSTHFPFRWLTLGHAARSGVWSSIIAAMGFKGDPVMLEDDWFLKTYGINADQSHLVKEIGVDEVFQKISMKPYCSAKQVIPAIYGLSKILSNRILPEEIKEIKISVPNEFARMIDHGASDRISSLTSAQYQLALLAYHPEKLYDISRTEIIETDEVHSFMNKIIIVGDKKLSNFYPEKWITELEVVTPKGILKEKIENAPGDPGMQFSRDKVLDKSRDFLQPLFGEMETSQFLKMIETELFGKKSIHKVFNYVKGMLV